MILDAEGVRFLTFDCYGTLVDWESGILGTLVPLLEERGLRVDPAEVLRRYARFEAEEERAGWRPYRDVLARVAGRMCESFGVSCDDAARDALAASLPGWPPFADTVHALARLGARFDLAVVSNVDDDLFAGTASRLGIDFRAVVTAEQARAYKPDLRPFRLLLERLGAGRREVIHVAQSLYHDHAPAAVLGLTSVWVDRPSLLPGRGVIPPAVGPDVGRPAARVWDLAAVADLLGA